MFIGCSGWSFEDWVGRFYPVNMARKKEEWLRYYSSYFNTVEINSTFFREPDDFIVNGWIKKGSVLKDFEFSVKMPQTVTHQALINNEGEQAGVMASSFEVRCVKPLADNGLLGATLLQLSPYFKNEERSREALRSTLSALDTEIYRYAVEFRHRSWFDNSSGELETRAFELLQSLNVANVLADGPEAPVAKECSANHAYFRFHGRKREVWSDDEQEESLRLSRFDHLYTDEEIKQLAASIQVVSATRSQTRIYFSNNSRARSARNALQLMDQLGIAHKEKDIPVDDHSTVGPFLMSKR
ncbi:MAG: hypothetical protein A4E29_01070 [Methanomassiliicoccales archaeon PtaB.Bin134]|nr:MAG: hypothetical protein A4E29_01070 [Methanomassiliicoccales archaeon PtaB.Bin134]